MIPPPPKSTASVGPPPRSSSPALSISPSSRPSTPNFLSQSTRGRPAAPTTLNFTALLGDLDTLSANPNLFSRIERDQSPTSPHPTLEQLAKPRRSFPEDLSRDDAARVAQEWLDKMDTVSNKADHVLTERPDQGQRGRADKLEGWAESVERGLGTE
ncbi:hypothetical protein JCM16303_004355 [Sporobolomyces ruberrimus]